jgi:hypothetical protein
VSLQFGSSSSYVPWVKDTVIMKLFIESPEVVSRWPHLTLVAMRGRCNMPYAGAACLPIAAIIMVGCGRGPLKMLLVHLLASLGTIFGAVDDSVVRCLISTAWVHLPTSMGRMKCGRLVAGGVQIGDVVQFLGGVPKIIAVFVLGWVSHAEHRSCARALW